jgi:hypothetical protein
MKPPQSGASQTGLEYTAMTLVCEAVTTRPSKTLKVSKAKRNVTLWAHGLDLDGHHHHSASQIHFFAA